MRISDWSSDVCSSDLFIERETGRVDLATTNPSGLIFSDGFSAGQRISKVGKRLSDILASLIVLTVGLPLTIVAGLAVMLDSRGPGFYRRPRVGLFRPEDHTSELPSATRHSSAVLLTNTNHFPIQILTRA